METLSISLELCEGNLSSLDSPHNGQQYLTLKFLLSWIYVVEQTVGLPVIHDVIVMHFI